MLDEKLNALIRKYGIYDAIGGLVDFVETNNLLSRFRKSFKRIEGEIRLISALNDALDAVSKDAIVALWIRDKFHSHELKFFGGLMPRNRRKVRFIIQDAEVVKKQYYYGRPVLTSRDFMHTHPEIKAVIIMEWDSKKCANLLGRHFSGTIIDMYSVILQKNLLKFFITKSNQNLYADIFVAKHFLALTSESVDKQKWHKILIAHYLRIRDFLSVKKEIQEYVQNDYEDSEKYLGFFCELEAMLLDIKSRLKKRNQKDVFVFWLDALEKEEFFSMRWLGKTEGNVFHRAYTTMNFTTAVCKSILCGKNVKKDRLQDVKLIKLEESAFKDFRAIDREIHVFSNNFFSKLGKGIVHESCYPFLVNLPLMISIWYALDALLTSSNTCMNLLHCLETHANFQCGEIPFWILDFKYKDLIAPNQWIDFEPNVKVVCDYIDRQLEWYNEFLPSNATSIYMSDHGMEADLSEQNVNMPFKVIGKGIIPGNENRLFSYKDMVKLIDHYMNPSEANVSDAFTEYAVIDSLDPYDKGLVIDRTTASWNKYILERKALDKTYLKRYLQTTKVVTAEGEYYTINILGEETYYRDKECKINLISEPIYAERIAELREKAGKFYNPWKEKRQVAIDFYEYLGIEEKDILAQCY